MITFYAGNTLKGLTERILSEIPADGTGTHVVLVPDRYTLAVETAIATRLGATIHVEVLTFARLAMRLLGNAAWDCLTPEGCTMLLSKALYQVKDQLVYYRKVAEVEGFANEMYSSLVALRESGVSVEDLRRAAQRMRGRTKDKATDLATIYNQYLTVLNTQLDPTTRLQRLAQAIPTSAIAAATDFYVVDFYCFNHVQYEVLRALMIHARSVHIGYIADNVGGANRRIYPSDLRDKLMGIVSREGLFCETCLVYEPLSTHKQLIEDTLFGYQSTSAGAGTDASIRLFSAQDATQELRIVSAEIAKLLRAGYRYRDVAIVCAGVEAYEDAFRSVFAEYGIPLFRDTKVLLSQEPVVRYLLDMLDCERQNFSFDSVMKVVKNAFFTMDTADVAYFENYCRKYGIAYTRFLAPFTLTDEGRSAKPQDDLARAEKVRSQFVDGRIDVEGKATVGQFVQAVKDFFAKADVDARFADFYRRQLALGFDEGAKRSEQVPARLSELLSLMTRLLGDEPADLDKFIALLRSSLESVRISLLPQSADCVYIGEAKDSRYDRVKAMFVVGAIDGVLPETPQAGTILSDAFYSALQRENIVVYPTAKEEGRYAMFYLEQLLLLPEERLYVSYACRGKDNQPQYPSVLISALSATFGLEVEEGLGHTLSEQAANQANAYKVLLRTGRNMPTADVRLLYRHLSVEDRSRYDALFAQNTAPIPTPDALFFARDLTSISQLETYFACPYRHFVQYGLRATEREDSTLDVRETGTLLHAVLELFFKRNYTRVDDITEQDVHAEVDACIREVLASSPRYEGLSASEKKVQLARLKYESHIVVLREVLLARRSLFKPTQFEVSFGGDHPDYPAIDLGNGVRLRGKIDRIDRCDNERLVIDYKSGSVNVDLSQVYFGTKVQLYAYLGALQKAGFVPVGAFYKHVSGAYTRSGDATPPGALLGHAPTDERVLFEIDPALATQETSDLLTVMRGKDTWKNYVKGGIMLSTEQLQSIIDYVLALMQKAVDEIRTGYVEAKPLSTNVCEHCPACNMCANASYRAREERAVTIHSFEEVSHD